MKKIIILILMISFKAKGNFEFISIDYQGTGCPEGSVSTTFSPNNEALSVLFDEFTVQVPQVIADNDGYKVSNSRFKVDRNSTFASHKTCHFSINAKIPEGNKVDSVEIQVHARGATILDQGVDGYFATTLVGYNGMGRFNRNLIKNIAFQIWKTTRKAIDSEWSNQPKVVVPINSECSGQSNKGFFKFDLKNHLSAEIVNKDLSKSGIITVDSNDITGLVNFKVHTSPCFKR